MVTQTKNDFPEPKLPQSTNGALSMATIQREGVVVRVPKYKGIKADDQVSTPFEGFPKGPLVQFPPIHVVTEADINKGAMDLVLPASYVDSGWTAFKVSYSVQGKGESATIKVDVRP